MPIKQIPNSYKDILECIINEDILFRKDLIKDRKSAFGNIEVLNFTIDEFRDYLISDYLVIKKHDIEEKIKNVISSKEMEYKEIVEGKDEEYKGLIYEYENKKTL